MNISSSSVTINSPSPSSFIQMTSYSSNASTATIIEDEDFNVTDTSPSTSLTTQFSAWTSQGKRKSSRIDPIRSIEDINRVKTYLLTNGRTEQLRLRNHALFVLGISVGLRPSDLLKLHFYDILTPSGTIVKELPVGESKTNKINRPTINEEARNALSSYIDSLPSFSYSDIVFHKQGDTKTPMNENNLYKLMVKIGVALNLSEHMGAYTLRKTFAYWTIKLHPNNMNVMIALQEMLNHDSMHTTLHYSGITQDETRIMYNDINNLFNPTYKAPVTQNFSSEINQLISSLYATMSAEG